MTHQLLGRLVFLSALLALADAADLSSLSATAVFVSPLGGVQGSIDFAQTVNGTSVSATVRNLPVGAGAYHVHQLPITGDCSTAGTPYNPTNVSTACNASLPSTCSVGDLSGKFGVLENGVTQSYVDASVSLLTRDSIVGRSVVVHGADGAPIACATIVYANTPLKTVVATFPVGSPLAGTVTLQQPVDYPSAPTTILVDLAAANDSSLASLGHKWHVHVNAVQLSDALETTATAQRCLSAGGHYNPFNVNTTAPAYAAGCAANKSLCEVGDESGYFGRLDMPATQLFTDPYLPLSGPESVTGRSMVIHIADGGGPRLACASLVEAVPRTLTSVFARNGVSGSVVMSQLNAWSPTIITAFVEGAADAPYPWHIHRFPVVDGLCTAVVVGGHYDPFAVNHTDYATVCSPSSPYRFSACELGDISGRWGLLASASAATYLDFNTPLFGRYAVMGRSIVLHSNVDNSRVGCASIGYESAQVDTVVATFTTPIVGTITLRQARNQPDAETTILVDIAYPDTALQTFGHKWHVHVNAVGDDAAVPSLQSRCQSAGGHYNPLGVNVSSPAYASLCSPTTPLGCELGDLKGKHGNMSIPWTAANKRMFTDIQLPLSGPNSVSGRSIVIHTDNAGAPRLGCATLAPVVPRIAQAVFFTGPVAGVVSFSQMTSDDPTIVSVSVSGPDQDTALILHALPLTVGDGSCPAAQLGSIYDPTNARAAPTNAATCSNGSPPPAYNAGYGLCAVGNLYAKHGVFTPSNTVPTVWADYNSPLFGSDSIVGRTLAVHNRASDAIAACAVVTYLTAYTTLRATFDDASPLRGSITLRQPRDDPTAETLVFVDVRYADPNMTTTTIEHKWHVHDFAVSPPDDTSCQSAGGHYNPRNVNASSPLYATLCSPATPTGCELGDLSGRLGNIAIPGRYMYTDVDLPLDGDFSVANRSITIHAANATSPRLACATLDTLAPRRLSSVFSLSGQAGVIVAEQTLVTDPTILTSTLIGIPDSPNPWHIHQFPTLDGSCGATQVGGHYDPLDVNHTDYSTRCQLSSPTRFRDCELGDISNKVGNLVSGTPQTWFDFHLPLFGRLSVMGRSFVMHAGTTGARVGCANIGYPTTDITTATASFQLPDLVGTITLRQPAGMPDAETTILVDIEYVNAALTVPTSGHKWHVHTDPVGTDATDATLSQRCLSAGGHYNPLQANVSSPAYATLCSPTTPLACELGDLSGKHGLLAVPSTGSSKVMYTDVQLPLSGSLSVLNRSVVIHAANGGGPRVACADLVPLQPRSLSAYFFGNEGVSGSVMFTQAYAADPTLITPYLVGFTGARAFSLREFPVGALGECTLDAVGDVYNPESVTNASCVPGTYTHEGLCAVGDLSSKYGTLTSVDASASAPNGYFDYSVTLFGRRAVVGRSVVLSANESLWGDSIACGTIAYPTEVAQTVVVSSVQSASGLVTGSVTLRKLDDVQSTVHVILHNADPAQPSVDHGWGVYTNAPSADGSCTSLGGVYDPVGLFGLSGCSTDSPTACAVGDLTGKHGRLSAPAGASSTQYFFTDEQLPLGGDFSVLTRSLVLLTENQGTQVSSCASTTPLVARTITSTFAMNTYYGSVTLEQVDARSPTRITVSLTGAVQTPNPWHIHNFPVVDFSCDANQIGGHFNPFAVDAQAVDYSTFCSPTAPTRFGSCEVGDLSGKFGDLAANANGEWFDYSLSLFGPDAVAGRSVVLHSGTLGTRLACASLGYNGATAAELVTAVAYFDTDDAQGTITFRQAANDPLAPTTVFLDLWTSQNFEAPGVSWHVHSNAVGADADALLSSGNRCQSVGGHYNPSGVDTSNAAAYAAACSPSTPNACEVGDLTGKSEPVVLPALGASKLLYSIGNLPLSGSESIVMRSVVIHLPGSSARFACATITQLTAREVTAQVNMGGVSGTITFSQVYLTDPVTIDVDVRDLSGGPNPWYMRTLPSIDDNTGTNVASPTDCPSVLYDPFGRRSAADYDTACTSTAPSRWAACAAGDFVNKFGTLPPNGIMTGLSDPTISLFGRHAISRRSVHITMSAANTFASLACGTVGFFGSPTTVTASFVWPVRGWITLRQVAASPFSSTTVEWSLAQANATLGTTSGHNWHVHMDPVGSDGSQHSSLADRCQSTGAHYDPTARATADVGAYDCDAAAPFATCEIGDESGKLGSLSVSTLLSSRQLLVDASLPLAGALSVAGRSIVIHGAAGVAQRLACATLQVQETRVLKATLGTGSQGVSGSVTLSQDYEGAHTTASVSVTGLPAGGAKWYVQSLPVASGASVCDAAAVGDVYNPAAVSTTEPAYSTDCTLTSRIRQQACRQGDLAGRLGSLTQSVSSFDVAAFVLPLFGRQSVQGRSIVLTDASTDAPLACGTLEREGATVVTGTVAFSSGQLRGTIIMTQELGVPNGDTTLVVDVGIASRRRAAAVSGSAYSWGVRDGAASSGGCNALATAFNPTGASTSGCSASTPNLCAMGDLSGKFGLLTLPATAAQRQVFTDSTLPLQGPFSVKDQSMSVASPTNSSDPVACTALTTDYTEETPPDPNIGGSGGGSSSGGIIAGVIIGLILLVLIVIFFVVRRKRSQRTKYVTQSYTASVASNAAPVGHNPIYDSRAAPTVAPTASAAAPAPRTGPRPERYRALYAYTANAVDELELQAGDEVDVTSQQADGWYVGKNLRTRKSGICPGNYLEKSANSTSQLQAGVQAADARIASLQQQQRSKAPSRPTSGHIYDSVPRQPRKSAPVPRNPSVGNARPPSRPTSSATGAPPRPAPRPSSVTSAAPALPAPRSSSTTTTGPAKPPRAPSTNPPARPPRPASRPVQ